MALQIPHPKDSKYCCGGLNRGLAILGNSLYFLTPDTHLLAIDRRDGAVSWDVNAALSAGGSYGGTEAPLVVKDKVILGAAAGDYGIQGSIEALMRRQENTCGAFERSSAGRARHETWGGDSWKHGGGRLG